MKPHMCREQGPNPNISVASNDKRAAIKLYSPSKDVGIAVQIVYCPWCAEKIGKLFHETEMGQVYQGRDEDVRRSLG